MGGPRRRVLKFGGTSVGTAGALRSAVRIAETAARERPVVIVVSALAGVTDALEAALAGAAASRLDVAGFAAASATGTSPSWRRWRRASQPCAPPRSFARAPRSSSAGWPRSPPPARRAGRRRHSRMAAAAPARDPAVDRRGAVHQGDRRLLDVSIKTVETHRARLMERLDIHDVPGLVRFAIRSGLVSPDD